MKENVNPAQRAGVKAFGRRQSVSIQNGVSTKCPVLR